MVAPRTGSIRRLVLPALAAFLWLTTAVQGQEAPPPARSSVPCWDARGRVPFPGRALLHRPRGRRALARRRHHRPARRPQCLLARRGGPAVRTAQAGQRWIQQVAVDRTAASACTPSAPCPRGEPATSPPCSPAASRPSPCRRNWAKTAGRRTCSSTAPTPTTPASTSAASRMAASPCTATACCGSATGTSKPETQVDSPGRRTP